MQESSLCDDVEAGTMVLTSHDRPHSLKRVRSPSPKPLSPGATSYADTFAWGSRYLKRLETLETSEDFRATKNVEKNLQRGVIITTDYSGMGCAELAAKMLSTSVQEHGLDLGQGITCFRCADIDEDSLCRCSVCVNVVCVL